MNSLVTELEGRSTKSSKDLSSVESHLQDTQVQKFIHVLSNLIYQLFKDANSLFVMRSSHAQMFQRLLLHFLFVTHHCRSCSRRRRVRSCPSQPV